MMEPLGIASRTSREWEITDYSVVNVSEMSRDTGYISSRDELTKKSLYGAPCTQNISSHQER